VSLLHDQIIIIVLIVSYVFMLVKFSVVGSVPSPRSCGEGRGGEGGGS